GSLSPEEKAKGLHDFAHGRIQILISKPSIASQGLNWQHCARTAFVGLSDSYEQYYQCIRRFYRFGQPRIVHAHVILSALEQQIAHNVLRKERQANGVMDAMIAHINETERLTA
ncbi:MAG TPA: helicase, partial [Arthrobacter bacterium]|nr:helicase [Arthrobacter sp.]